ncbi:MAG: hypothetical protein Q9172_002654 [Xanthocarpia lactea]
MLSRNQYNTEVPTQRQEVVPSLVVPHPSSEHGQEVSGNSNLLLDPTFDVSNPDLAHLANEIFDPNTDFADFLSPQSNDEGAWYDPLDSSSVARPSSSPTDQVQHLQEASIRSANLSIQSLSTYSVRSFDHRAQLNTAAQRTSDLILYTLKSYPMMMLRDNSLPPFIHPYLVSGDIENNDMEPLTNCINLVHMLSSRHHGSRKLFWKNVRMECESLYVNNPRLNRWELLAGMQALSIYILLRLDEGATDHNDFDPLMITTVIALSRQFNGMDSDIASTTPQRFKPESGWKNWILEESTRRLCIVYQVVNMLVYFEPAALCDVHSTGLVLGPLPARRQLWEADDELAWMKESDESTSGQFGLATSGELWITEASTSNYRVGKAAPGLFHFRFDEVEKTSIFINKTYNGEKPVNINELAGRYPDTWTVPVCDTSTWGAAWNWDFINKKQPILEYGRQGKQLMPCLCGDHGLDTAAWIRAAGMLDFDTYYDTCQALLTWSGFGFQWPESVHTVLRGQNGSFRLSHLTEKSIRSTDPPPRDDFFQIIVHASLYYLIYVQTEL